MRVDDLRLLHLEPQVVAFAGALAHAGEDRYAAVLQGDIVDQLHDDDSLADTSAAEQPDLPAAQIRLEEIDDLDSRLEHLQLGRLVLERRGRAMDRPALRGGDRAIRKVHRFAEDVHDPAERRGPDRHRDRRAGVDHRHAAAHAVGGLHRDRPHAVLPEVLLDLRDDVDDVAGVRLPGRDPDGAVDGGKLPAGEFDVDHGSNHLDDFADLLGRCCFCRCCHK